MPSCFAIMPFKAAFNDIEKIIKTAIEQCGMEYVRGDLTNRPGSIMAQVVHEIRRASVVIADITENNPNVFYELGVAHEIKGPDRVVILTQNIDPARAFDVHQFRQLVYTHDEVGRRKLRKELPERIKKASESLADQAVWSVVRGQLPRTLMLVRDLERLLDQATPKQMENTVIRIAAGLSSLAISDLEPGDPKDDPEYIGALLTERNCLRQALCRGAKLRAVLNPPRRFTQALAPARLKVRYSRMIQLLQGSTDTPEDLAAAEADIQAMKRCEFILSPVATSNLFIIGDFVAYEGMKRGGTGGFEITHIESDPREVRELIRQFDVYFSESRADLKHTHPPDGQVTSLLQRFFDEANTLDKRRERSRRASNGGRDEGGRMR